MTARDEPQAARGPSIVPPDAARPVAPPAHQADPWAAGPGSQIVIEHVTPFAAARRRFFRHRLAIVGLVIVTVVILMSVFAPLLSPWNPNFVDLSRGSRMPPDSAHILGTDVSARDIWSRVLYGGRTSLIVGFVAVGLYLIIGTLLGLAAGFYGGVVDQLLMRFTDIIMSIPSLLLIIVFVSIVGPSIYSVIIVIALLAWGPTARLVRGQLLVLRESEFITAARVVGVPDRVILFRHMLPNVFGPLTVVATFGVATAVLLESSLSFLGLGVRPPTSSWGNLITEATNPVILNDVPWQWVPPAIMTNITGQITPVKAVCEMARARGVETIVDGAHSFAQFYFKQPDLNCDYFGTSLHKWLYAPKGTGMLYIRREKIAKVWPLFAAEDKQKNDIRKFEEIGTHSAAPKLAIGEAMLFHNGIGGKRKEARLRYLSRYWMDQLKNIPKVRFNTSFDPAQMCAIANVQIEGLDQGKIGSYLFSKHHIFTTPIVHEEFQGLRITPNLYTTLPELDRFCEVMAMIARKGLPA